MHIPYPESPRVLRPASLARRLLAMLYDTLLVIALWMVLGAIAVTLNGGEAVDGPLWRTVLFVATYLFFAYFWTRSGQTLGMLAWQLRVQTVAGGHINWTQALTRYMVAIPSLLLCGLGYFWILIGDEKLSWGDRLSDTRVVQLEKKKP
ncbi:RDD family protein [Marinobacterium aestuariivivens]|uniref:RDD family protein n=1 Tax=Marinobacterium aestuariivivens TaxID=1698799 RepID=A0ABW2A2C5_9GAMM